MKKFMMLAASAVVATVFGCAAPGSHHGIDGTTMGSIYTSVSAPSGYNALTTYHMEGPGYTTTGVVEAEGTATNILGWIASGDTSYKTLLDKAKAGGADSVMDVYYDAKIMDVLGLYCKVDYHLYATGVKFKK